MKNNYLDHTINHICNTFDKNEPFDSCSFCNSEFKKNEIYYIEKAFKHHIQLKSNDIILEYALCATCMEEIRANLSIESRQKIDLYFEENLNPSFVNSGKQCCIYGENIYETEEYQVIAVCRSGQLEEGARPLIIGAKAMEEIQVLLSAKTKDELYGFFDRITNMPLELKKILMQGDYFVL